MRPEKFPSSPTAKKLIGKIKTAYFTYEYSDDRVKVILRDPSLNYRKALYKGKWNAKSHRSEMERSLVIDYCVRFCLDIPKARGE